MRQVIATGSNLESVEAMLIVMGAFVFLGLVIIFSKKIQKKINKNSTLFKILLTLGLSILLFHDGVLNTIPRGESPFIIYTKVKAKSHYIRRGRHHYEIVCPYFIFEVKENIYNQLQPADEIRLRVQKSLGSSLLLDQLYLEKEHKSLIII